MPKRKPTRSQRRRSQRSPAPPAPVRAAPRPVMSQAAPAEAESEPEPSVTRFASRDFTYVRRELRNIILLAGAIIITIVVLSFFLP